MEGGSWGREAFETETGQDRLRGTDRFDTASLANNLPVVTILKTNLKKDHNNEI